MPIDSLSVPMRDNLSPRIAVFGVGGGGGNAIRTMLERGLEGVEFIAANTDAQALNQISGEIDKIQLGVATTEGLGAGANPEIGREAALESIEEIKEKLLGVHLCFLTLGMGGGTGTGASPVIAEAARDLGVITVGVVTKPFFFEGPRRMEVAEKGVEELQDVVNTLLVIPNQNLYSISREDTTTRNAFGKADEVLYYGVKSITDLMVRPGLINLDFADVKSVLKYPGRAIMGVGLAEGEDRGRQAAINAMNNQLLEETDLADAKGVLINIIGGDDQTLFDLSDASDEVRKRVSDQTHVIVGTTQDSEYDHKVRVSLVATGLSVINASVEEPSIDFMDDGYADEPILQNGNLPSDLWTEDEVPDENRMGDGDESECSEEVPDGHVNSAPQPCMQRESSEFPFVAPQMSSTGCSPGDDSNQEIRSNLGYKKVLNSIQSEETANEAVEDVADEVVQEPEEPESTSEEPVRNTKSKLLNFNFLDRRHKPPDDKSKVPAFIRRQAN